MDKVSLLTQAFSRGRFAKIRGVGRRKGSGFIIAVFGLLAVAAGLLWQAPLAQAAGQALRLEVIPVKEIYSSREGVLVQFRFTAASRVKMCLAKDFLSQMSVTVTRSGSGKLPLAPLVVKDHSEVFAERMRVRWLEAGEQMTLRANLKRFRFADGQPWKPGEYSVNAVFNLCEQTEGDAVNPLGKETPVPAKKPGWFMIMS